MNSTLISAKQILNDLYKKKKEINYDKGLILNEKNYSILMSIKRKEFENLLIKKGRVSKAIWFEYINWEENNGSLSNLRKIWERFINRFVNDDIVWVKYVSFELRNGNITKARTILERSIEINSNSLKLWNKYIELETILKNFNKVRKLFKKILIHIPSIQNWYNYLNFEKLYGTKSAVRRLLYYLLYFFKNKTILQEITNFEIFNGNIKSLRFFYNTCLLNDISFDCSTLLKISYCELFSKNIYKSAMFFSYALKSAKIFGNKIFKSPKNYRYQNFKYLTRFSTDMIKMRIDFIMQLENNTFNTNIWLKLLKFEIEKGNLTTILTIFEIFISKFILKKNQKFYFFFWEKIAFFLELSGFQNVHIYLVFFKIQNVILSHNKNIVKFFLEYCIRNRYLINLSFLFSNVILKEITKRIFLEYKLLKLGIKSFKCFSGMSNEVNTLKLLIKDFFFKNSIFLSKYHYNSVENFNKKNFMSFFFISILENLIILFYNSNIEKFFRFFSQCFKMIKKIKFYALVKIFLKILKISYILTFYLLNNYFYNYYNFLETKFKEIFV